METLASLDARPLSADIPVRQYHRIHADLRTNQKRREAHPGNPEIHIGLLSDPAMSNREKQSAWLGHQAILNNRKLNEAEVDLRVPGGFVTELLSKGGARMEIR